MSAINMKSSCSFDISIILEFTTLKWNGGNQDIFDQTNHWMARPIFVNETDTEPLKSLKTETKPRFIAHKSRKQDQDYTNVSFNNET